MRALRRAAAPCHDPYANGLTAYRMRSAYCLRGFGTSAPSPLRQYARAYAYRGLRALASLSMARSECSPRIYATVVCPYTAEKKTWTVAPQAIAARAHAAATSGARYEPIAVSGLLTYASGSLR